MGSDGIRRFVVVVVVFPQRMFKEGLSKAFLNHI